MSHEIGDLGTPPPDGRPTGPDSMHLQILPDPNAREPSEEGLGDPSKFTDEPLVAGHTAKLMDQNNDAEAVKYLIGRTHANGETNPSTQNIYWRDAIHDLTSPECYNMPFDRLQQAAKTEFGIKDLSSKTPPTEAMYKATNPSQIENGVLKVPPPPLH